MRECTRTVLFQVRRPGFRSTAIEKNHGRRASERSSPGLRKPVRRPCSASWLDAIPPDAIPQFHCPFRAAPCLMAFAVEVLQL